VLGEVLQVVTQRGSLCSCAKANGPETKAANNRKAASKVTGARLDFAKLFFCSDIFIILYQTIVNYYCASHLH